MSTEPDDGTDRNIVSPPVERSPDLWFEDGNIILHVEATQFRVFKSVLAKHSTVLKDMLLIPLPPDEPLIDGCPVVNLVGDTAMEWEFLLQAMFPSVCFERMPSISEMAAILRLSRKYDVPLFRAECIIRLRADLPDTLDGYMQVLGNWQFMIQRDGECISELIASAKEAGLVDDHLRNVVRLSVFVMYGDFREVAVTKQQHYDCVYNPAGLYSILPLALYRLAADAITKDGVLSREPKIPLSDQVDFLKGCMRISHLHTNSVPLKWLYTVPPAIPAPGSCLQVHRCAERASALRSSICVPGSCKISLFTAWEAEWSKGLCSACVAAGREAVLETRRELWTKLPSFFGLPDWEDLAKMDLE
ncbi:BTB domain-containing protein [Mycena kentingensis (nom. inval.)]|nr:BTB domain-containing protein [Mycena kentingensis (nom. inval.)]